MLSAEATIPLSISDSDGGIAMKKLLFVIILCLACLLASCGGKGAEGTKGLEYAPAEEGQGVVVVGYNGSHTEVVIPDEYRGQRVVAIADEAFGGNESITAVSLGANVESVGVAAFAGCKSLYGFYAAEGLEKIGNGAFFGCTSLGEAELPSSLKSVGVEAFGLCESMDRVSYNGNQSMWRSVSVAAGNDVFDASLVLAEGGSLVKLLAEGKCNSTINWQIDFDGVLYISGEGHIPDYEFDETPWGQYALGIISAVVGDGIDIVGKNCFFGCVNMQSVTLAPSVRLIDDGAFYNCKRLKSIELPENLRRIGDNAFLGCAAIVDVTIPESVTAIGSGAFMGCGRLERVNIPLSVSTIKRWCFAECASLSYIDLSSAVSVETGAFYGCELLDEITVSERLTSVGINSFLGCPKIKVNGAFSPSVRMKIGNSSIQ